ncbi:AaceriAGR073Cp [[Ashbya] aceris (nom. inval.)]|nr:AaceriAGR073Cp [[Ashbya] aceris (nom. inval.)]
MAKRGSGNKRYVHPLPIEPVALPPLIPHNPLSWVFWVLAYATSSNQLARKIQLEIDREGRCTVTGRQQMQYLWDHGFFGTGQLSRSEPTWQARTVDRLQLDAAGIGGHKLEEVTQLRRKQRLEFKRERASFERKRLELRRQGVLESEILEQERLWLKQLRDRELQWEASSADPSPLRIEDAEILTDDGAGVLPIEKLELMPVEALFLTLALPVLDADAPTIVARTLGAQPALHEIERLCRLYAAYHHYRSHGWCVRSGIKFGCDFLLYRRGPPFHHAEFSVMVLAPDERHDYTWYSTVARVVGGAQKTLVLSYVALRAADEQLANLWNSHRYMDAFALFEIRELVYRRWLPGKNRE